jgi:hypothetical protein
MAKLATVQVLGADGKPLKVDIKGTHGLDPRDVREDRRRCHGAAEHVDAGDQCAADLRRAGRGLTRARRFRAARQQTSGTEAGRYARGGRLTPPVWWRTSAP